MKSSGLSKLGQRTTDPPISWLMRLALEQPDLISLAAGFTDDFTLPVTETKALLDELLAAPKAARAALQYGSTPGDPRLRALTVARLAEQDRKAGASSAPFSAERLLVTHGSQQLLYMVTECLCDPGDIVLVEDPTYFVYLSILQSHGLECRGIPLEADGIDLKHLERVLSQLKRSGDLPRVKMLYAVTYFQNPSGTTTSYEKKAGALALLRHFERAADHPIYLLEDAAYRELRFEGPSAPSALSLRGAGQRVIYAGTYSKPFATGIRVGYGLLPEALLPVVARVKGNHDFGTSQFLQKLLARALESCRYRHHLSVLQQRYAHKAGVLSTALRRHLPAEVEWAEPRGGLYIWARLPKRIRTGPRSSLFKKALERQVLYVPGALCYAPDPTRPVPDHEMRLSFGSASEGDLREGVARLGEVMRSY
jgi:2-aminoadipate transaminase